MPDFTDTKELFFSRNDLDQETCRFLLSQALNKSDDGELFFEHRQSESLTLEDSRIRSAAFDIVQGFGLRAVSGDVTSYAHSNVLSLPALQRAADTVQAAHINSVPIEVVDPTLTNQSFYTSYNPLNLASFEEKIATLSDIDIYARRCDSRVKQVIATLAGNWQVVYILRATGQAVADVRPLVRLYISIVVTDGIRKETGSYGSGGRTLYEHLIAPSSWRVNVDEALRQALINLESVPAPAGEMQVVLGPGWPGVLLHEAVGHGLEGDFNRKKTSAFSSLLGKQIASPDVTVVDDGTLLGRRGSLSVDDEGTPTRRTVLIENGVLKGYIQDRLNARLMGSYSTGNGRRQSYAYMPLPRMTNTFMVAGDTDPEEILASVRHGLYAVYFGGGQVDITSGKFVFSATEAYLIENGKIGPAVRGATLIGNGPNILTKVSLVGNDLKLDNGTGTCGKNGQTVPVGVGQPTIRIDNMTVGGTTI